MNPLQIALAYTVAAGIAYLGHRARALSVDGAVAACLVGGTVFGFGGWAWAILLVLFFSSSSLLSLFKASESRKQRAARTFEKGGRRDAAQVLANGGIPALLALISAFVQPAVLPLVYSAYAGALAAAAADTWATEIGVLSKRPPRLITNGRTVPPGTSGGVTLLGSSAAVAGALLMGAAAAAPAIVPFLASGPLSSYARPLVILFAAGAGGVVGALVDSLLGAALQASYRCPRCDQPTESALHSCGTQTELVKGIRGINNDRVNVLAVLVGALLGGAVGLM
jgi:uncharacterized protein (TIGR00297 family)